MQHGCLYQAWAFLPAFWIGLAARTKAIRLAIDGEKTRWTDGHEARNGQGSGYHRDWGKSKVQDCVTAQRRAMGQKWVLIEPTVFADVTGRYAHRRRGDFFGRSCPGPEFQRRKRKLSPVLRHEVRPVPPAPRVHPNDLTRAHRVIAELEAGFLLDQHFII